MSYYTEVYDRGLTSVILPHDAMHIRAVFAIYRLMSADVFRRKNFRINIG